MKHTVVEINSRIKGPIPSVTSDYLVPKSHTWVGNFIEQAAGGSNPIACEVGEDELVKHGAVVVAAVLEEMLVDYLRFG